MPEGYGCPHYEPLPGSKRCESYLSNGGCFRADMFMCVEWLRANGHGTGDKNIGMNGRIIGDDTPGYSSVKSDDPLRHRNETFNQVNNDCYRSTARDGEPRSVDLFGNPVEPPSLPSPPRERSRRTLPVVEAEPAVPEPAEPEPAPSGESASEGTEVLEYRSPGVQGRADGQSGGESVEGSAPNPTAGTVTLRPYQMDAVIKVDRLVDQGTRRILIVAPTGAGKTSLAGYLIWRAVESGRRVLFLAHRRELINQPYQRLLQMGLSEDQVGVIMAQDPRRRPGAPVQVASVDTLRNRRKPPADIVIRDEAHRAMSKTDRGIAASYPDAIHLGLTATPYRADGKGLGDAYDELVVVATPRDLIDEGFLVEPKVFTVPQNALPDLSAVKVKRGDYDEKALADAVDQAALVGNIVEHWHKHAHGVRTVAFAVNVAHSKHIVEQFREAGVSAEHLDGGATVAERQAVLDRLARGETRVVANCNLFAEGWDQPSVKCAILARPTKSTGLYLQQAGRILRPYEDQPAIILDHAGCVLEHGLPQEQRQFSLHTRRKDGKRPAGGVVPTTKACEKCFLVVAAQTRTCPVCGFVFVPPREEPKQVDGELIEMREDSRERKEFTWRRLCGIARKRGLKPGWVYHRYREKFREDPPADFEPPTWRPRTDVEKQAYFEKLKESLPSEAWARTTFRVEMGHWPS